MSAGIRIVLWGIALLWVACTNDPGLPPGGDAEAALLPAGRACTANDECQSGHCIALPAGDACAALCAGSCPAGMVCKRADGRDPSASAICVPIQSRLCQECVEDTDCGPYGDLCLEEGLGQFCGVDCSETDDCPEGFSCTSIRNDAGLEQSRQCVPESGTCTCGPANDGLERPCQKTTPGVGTCAGEETCDGGVGWVDCDARTPQYEVCDHQDNDCDGATDEDLNGDLLIRPCGYGPSPRRRECAGFETCVNGIYTPCSLSAPPDAETVCDGLDDDCNGEVDDGLLGSVNACNGCDDVCPPGPIGDESTVRTCTSDDDDHYCDQIACYVPYFDVNHSDEDGCEVTDDHQVVGDYTFVNDAWFASFQLGDEDLECTDGGDYPAASTDWFINACALKIPSDNRQHVPAAPPQPNVDYWHFFAKDTFLPGPICEPDTWACALFGAGPEGYDGIEIEVCGSVAIGNLYEVPSFPPDRCDAPPGPGEEFTDCCWLLDLGVINWVSIPLATNDESYFYIRIKTIGEHYSGTYALAAYDWSWGLNDGGYEACPLGTDLDPCTY